MADKGKGKGKITHDPDVYIHYPAEPPPPGQWTSAKARSKISHDIADFIAIKEQEQIEQGRATFKTTELYVRAESVQQFMASERGCRDPPDVDLIIAVAQSETHAKSGDPRFIVHRAPDGTWIAKKNNVRQ